jgi:hypothetical protein
VVVLTARLAGSIILANAKTRRLQFIVGVGREHKKSDERNSKFVGLLFSDSCVVFLCHNKLDV